MYSVIEEIQGALLTINIRIWKAGAQAKGIH